jgi:hypothetical protein
MLSTKDFYDREFYGYCQRQYDEARRFLKTCGKPKDETARFLVDFNRETARIFGGLLDLTLAAEKVQKRKALIEERVVLLYKLAVIDGCLALQTA